MSDQGFTPERMMRREARARETPPDPQNEEAASLARAEARIRQLRDTMPAIGGYRDKFDAPKPPPGYDYQWKRRTIFGWEDPSYSVELVRNGWEPVPLSRHPEMMPRGWKGETIEVEGQVLMERPMYFTQRAREHERLMAREAVAAKEQQLRATGKNDLGQREVLNFSKTREAIHIPEDE